MWHQGGRETFRLLLIKDGLIKEECKKMCTYTKTFIFRDYSDDCIVNENVNAINNLFSLHRKQKDSSCGDLKTTSSFGAYKNEDDGTWVLAFYKEGGVEWLTIPFSGRFLKCKEIHLCFEIEEDIKTGFKIQNCDITPFKEYQS